ncbi:uncharacterized protein LOC117638610 [Prunus dulcis]|uniref:uncharacterized protein LOC117638610 n=1 Tax=Prunus dulcis TaxID=3755 RepID=UPI001482C5CF|nr:uncharacterized protein LOC117638610 [Prunus dulcis]
MSGLMVIGMTMDWRWSKELGFGSVVMYGVDGGICSGPCKMKWYVLFDYLNPQVPLTKKKLQCLNGHWELDGLKTEERSLDMLQPASKGIHIQALKLRYLTFGLTVTKPGGLRIEVSNVLFKCTIFVGSNDQLMDVIFVFMNERKWL